MAVVLCIMEINNLITTDTKLTALGYSESQRLVIILAMKTFITTTYIFVRFYARPYINQMAVLKISAVVIALTVAWIPCLTAYPILSVVLKFIEVFFFTIGPFLVVPLQMYRIRDLNSRSFEAIRAVIGNFFLPFGLPLYALQALCPQPPLISLNQFICFNAVVLFAILSFNETKEKNERLDEQAKQRDRRGVV